MRKMLSLLAATSLVVSAAALADANTAQSQGNNDTQLSAQQNNPLNLSDASNAAQEPQAAAEQKSTKKSAHKKKHRLSANKHKKHHVAKPAPAQPEQTSEANPAVDLTNDATSTS